MNRQEPAGAAILPQAARQFCFDVLGAVGADRASAEAATRAMLHGSVHGIDSHGVRLLDHYATAFEGGRLNTSPRLTFRKIRRGSGLLEADHAHGALATFRAMEQACDLAEEAGIAGVGIRNSSHFGPAGAFAVTAAERGMLGLVLANSDSFVRLHDGAAPFHGTNPIGMAMPSGGENPWLLDMATSAIPYNRVQLYRSTGQPLPEATASDAEGADTQDADAAAMLAPVGAGFGFKGAGLAGMAEVFAAALTGMRLSPEILPMGGPDFATPRGLGAFVLAIDPDGFIGAEIARQTMARYLEALRASPARPGTTVLAPGDREWAEAERRRAHGIPIDPATLIAFERLSARYGVDLPSTLR